MKYYKVLFDFLNCRRTFTFLAKDFKDAELKCRIKFQNCFILSVTELSDQEKR